MKKFINCNKYYLTLLVFMALVFFLINQTSMSLIIDIDNTVCDFVQSTIVRDSLTLFFKIVTNLGDAFCFGVLILIFLFFFRKKKYTFFIILNLLFVYLTSVVFKNLFRRSRPLYNLIEKPKDFSFPSGHTMCSVAFYGMLIYLVNKRLKNKYLKVFINTCFVLTIIIIAFSRIYLNVHYFSDVVGGFILGIICLRMFIRYDKIEE